MEEEGKEILMILGKIKLLLRKCFRFMRAEQSPTLQTHLMNSKAGFCMCKCEPGLFGNSPDMSLT